MLSSIHLVFNAHAFRFISAAIDPPESFLGAKQHNSELGIGHTPFPADIFFFFTFEVQSAQNHAVAFGQLRQAVIDGVAAFRGFRPPAGRRYPACGISGSRIGSRLIRRRYSRITLRQTPFRNAPNSSVLRIVLPLLGAQKPHQAFLHQIVHIGAIVAHMIEDLVAKLEPQAIEWMASFKSIVRSGRRCSV